MNTWNLGFNFLFLSNRLEIDSSNPFNDHLRPAKFVSLDADSECLILYNEIINNYNSTPLIVFLDKFNIFRNNNAT